MGFALRRDFARGLSMRNMVLGLMLVLVGCSSERARSPGTGSVPGDAATARDTGPSDAALSDAGADAGVSDATVTDAGGLSTVCEGDCQALTAVVELNSTQATFQKAFYGLSISTSNPGVAQLYIEASMEGGAGCPMESSPTPDWLLVISNIPVPLSADPVSDDLSVTFVDFSGQLLMNSPISRATTSEVQLTSAQLCIECVGMTAPSQPDGHVALDVMATFEQGSAMGHIYATHCDSLDTIEE